MISIDCVFADNGSNNDSDLEITMLHYPRLGYESSPGSDSKSGGDAVLLHSGNDYLLMDTFDGKRASTSHEGHPIVQYLKNKGINEISVYLSHYHSDHYGGLISILNSANIRVKTIYLPKSKYLCDAQKYENDKKNLGQLTDDELYIYPKYNAMLSRINLIKNNNEDESKQKIEIKYLWPTNETYTTETDEYKNCFGIVEKDYLNEITLNNGKVKIDIIGPLKNSATNLYNDEYYNNGITSNNVKDTNGNEYINNHSLVAMVSVGNTKFLTAGDINEYQENLLIDSGINIKADIMKASHHVNANSNTRNFIKSVAPKYIFVQNGSAKNPDAMVYDYNNNRAIKNFDVNSYNDTLRYMMEGDYYNYQECTNDNCYRGANLYWEQYNGITNFSIKNDIISVNSDFEVMNNSTNFYPSDYTFLNKLQDNMKNLTINYVDKDTNEIISKKVFNFATNVTYHLFESDFNKNIEGYEFVSADDIPIDGRITSDMENPIYNIYFKKIKNNTSNNLVNVPDTLSNDYMPIIMFIITIIGLGTIIYGIKKRKG